MKKILFIILGTAIICALIMSDFIGKYVMNRMPSEGGVHSFKMIDANSAEITFKTKVSPDPRMLHRIRGVTITDSTGKEYDSFYIDSDCKAPFCYVTLGIEEIDAITDTLNAEIILLVNGYNAKFSTVLYRQGTDLTYNHETVKMTVEKSKGVYHISDEKHKQIDEAETKGRERKKK